MKGFVKDEEYISAQTTFNEAKVTQGEPFIEGSATYDLIPSNFREFTATGGSSTFFETALTWYEDL